LAFTVVAVGGRASFTKMGIAEPAKAGILAAEFLKFSSARNCAGKFQYSFAGHNF